MLIEKKYNKKVFSHRLIQFGENKQTDGAQLFTLKNDIQHNQRILLLFH
jgi:hypothetical protein